MTRDGISIIVCFYNAEKRLTETLSAIRNLKVEGLPFVELVLVDNNSNDSSVSLIHRLMSDFDRFSWKVVTEGKPGLSFARKAGIDQSIGAYLLFCDDDNWLHPEYLLVAHDVFKKHPEIGVLGGFGEAVSDALVFPHWFKEHQVYYAVGPQNSCNGEVAGGRNMVYGAGMIIDRSKMSWIEEQGFRSFTADRTGKSLSSGGDSELCLALKVAGFKIWYDDRLKFRHFIEEDRLDLAYIARLKAGIRASNVYTKVYLDYLRGYHPHVTLFYWLKELLYSIRALFRSKLSQDDLEVARIKALMKLLLKERFRYNQKVAHILNFCKKVSNREYHG